MKESHTVSECPISKTIHRLFEEQVEKAAGSVAVVGPSGSEMVTYEELDRLADRLADSLVDRGVDTGSIVGLMITRSIEMVTAMMGVLKAGGAYLPIDRDYPGERINYILRDSGAEIVLTEAAGVGAGPDSPHLHRRSPAADSPAYVLYTSGTTGRPKGVLVEHRSVVNVLRWFGKRYNVAAGVRVIQLSRCSFDPSVEQIFATLLHGATLHLAPPELVVDTRQLRRYIEVHRINIINFVPTVLDELLGYGPKLDSLRSVISGAERLTDEIKDRLIAKGYDLTNHYGPTETTIEATASRCTAKKVNIGRPIDQVTCHIFTEEGHAADPGEPGELCISGAGVARGYLNNPELTAEKFVNIAAKAREDTRRPQNTKSQILNPKSYILYKTGDLARCLPDGNIEFLGRLDDQLKIRGYRVEPAEIEQALLAHPDVKQAVVMAADTPSGGKQLAAYIVPRARPARISPLREYLRGQLPDYLVPGLLVPLDRLPLHPNGKVDRQALAGLLAGAVSGNYQAPRDRLERKLVDIWARVIGIDEGSLGIDADFFELGGNSLNVNRMMQEVHREFNVKIDAAEIFRLAEIGKLAEYIRAAAAEPYRPIEAVEKREYYPLSSAQERFYVLQQMAPNSTGYNISEFFLLEGSLDSRRLTGTFKELIGRHESFRTYFTRIKGEPRQRISSTVHFAGEYVDMDDTFIRPFDLAQAPLLRVGLIRIDHGRHILMIDMHHIISDGVSLAILMREFLTLYAGGIVPPLPIQYKEYAQWQNKRLFSEDLLKQEKYWLAEFGLGIPALNMRLDYPRPAIQSFDGDAVTFDIGEDLTDQLKEVASTSAATLFMVLLAAYAVLLFKYTGCETMVVGYPVAGREHADLANIIGMFVNTVALKIPLNPAASFFENLAAVKEKCLQAFQNQDYPFDSLVDKLNYKRDAGRNPVFDTLFVLQNQDMGEIEMENLKIGPYEFKKFSSPFDFWLEGVDKSGCLCFSLGYCTRLFHRETMENLSRRFVAILTQIAAAPHRSIKDMDLASAYERDRILHCFNRSREAHEYDFI
jgi:fengycin family lipopeptide synthetase D